MLASAAETGGVGAFAACRGVTEAGTGEALNERKVILDFDQSLVHENFRCFLQSFAEFRRNLQVGQSAAVFEDDDFVTAARKVMNVEVAALEECVSEGLVVQTFGDIGKSDARSSGAKGL